METTNAKNGKAAGSDGLGNDNPSSSDCRYGVMPVAAQPDQCGLCRAPAPGDMLRMSSNNSRM